MKSIAYVVSYFGKLPKSFGIFLMSCENNPTVDWLIFTDDKTAYNYPQNVKVFYYTFEEIKKKVQKCYDFEIVLDKPYKFCDYKPAYGEIFHEELKKYDYWGMCDLDMAWGNIRHFMTDDILNKYERIGIQGHSTIFKNISEVNARYRTLIKNGVNYKKAYTTQGAFAFDEVGMDNIYKELDIKCYDKTNYANLKKYDYGFFLELMPKSEDYKNKNQIFLLEDGELKRYYIYENQIHMEEFFYIHFWCRPITYKPKKYNKNKTYVIYADVVEELKSKIDINYIVQKSKKSKLKYYIKSIWFNRKKITLKKIIFNVKGMLKYSKEK